MAHPTALITGASTGIGEQLARKLAQDGHDVVLVARRADKLEALSHELEAQHGVSAHVIAADLADPAAPEQIHAQVAAKNLTIHILVNNAGFGSSGSFLDLELSSELRMVQVNVSSLIALAHGFGRGMRMRGAGRILNIASTAGFQPGPYMATYYATKAFVIAFSLALAHELRDSGVTVTCHCPGPTDTEFVERAGIRKNRLFQTAKVATAEAVAEHAYRAMLAGRPLAVHGALNRLGAAGVRFVPRAILAPVIASLNRRVQGPG
ncbi:MAG TPA: SDR family oxidoreductase [Polyangiaceae bacterium]|jgi:short-subunit dehydrogenase|nr:SDR family oxidoreductase [Polyangiaceae bacterium]